MPRDIDKVNRYIQSELHRRGLTEATAVEVARCLDEAGLLRDSPTRTGKPLRDLLRANKIKGAVQLPNRRWLIRRLSQPSASDEDSAEEEQIVEIGSLDLKWNSWTSWSALQQGSFVPVPEEAGVYQVARAGEQEMLIIGESQNLDRRIRRDLLDPQGTHSSGQYLRIAEDLRQIRIRWAVTDRPHAVKEELLRLHQDRFGKLPVYMKRA